MVRGGVGFGTELASLDWWDEVRPGTFDTADGEGEHAAARVFGVQTRAALLVR